MVKGFEMIAIVINDEKRTTYDNVLCHELNIKTKVITLYIEGDGSQQLNHNDTSIILKKDGVIVDWVWSKNVLAQCKNLADKLWEHYGENGIKISELEERNMYNPFPMEFVGEAPAALNK